MAKYTIELDCEPFAPRPSSLLPGILDGTGLKIDPEATISRFFGCWIYEVPEDQEKLYLTVRETVKNRITALYNQGRIRAGGW